MIDSTRAQMSLSKILKGTHSRDSTVARKSSIVGFTFEQGGLSI